MDKTVAAIEQRKQDAYEFYKDLKSNVPEAFKDDFQKLNDYIHQPVDLHGLTQQGNTNLKASIPKAERDAITKLSSKRRR